MKSCQSSNVAVGKSADPRDVRLTFAACKMPVLDHHPLLRPILPGSWIGNGFLMRAEVTASLFFSFQPASHLLAIGPHRCGGHLRRPGEEATCLCQSHPSRAVLVAVRVLLSGPDGIRKSSEPLSVIVQLVTYLHEHVLCPNVRRVRAAGADYISVYLRIVYDHARGQKVLGVRLF